MDPVLKKLGDKEKAFFPVLNHVTNYLLPPL